GIDVEVDAALDLGVAGPAAAARILARKRLARAGLGAAADAGVAFRRQRMFGDFPQAEVHLDVALRPVGEGRDLDLAALHAREGRVLARAGLVAAQARDEGGHVGQGEEAALYLHLVDAAAGVHVGDAGDAVLRHGILPPLGLGPFGGHGDEVQAPGLHERVAVGE